MKKNDISRIQAEKYLPKIAKFFSLGKIAHTIYLPEALSNHNWKVTTDKEMYIFKILVGLRREGLDNYNAIQQQLAACGIQAPIFIHSGQGKRLFQEDNILAVVSPIIKGRYPPALDEKFCYATGKILAIFHTNVTYLPFNQTGWLSYRTYKPLSPTTNKKIIAKAKLFVGEAKEIFDRYLPEGIIHGDIFDYNVFVDPKNPYKITTILDFETAEKNILLLDIARTCLEICQSSDKTHLDDKRISALINGYSTIRKLNKNEKSSFKLAIIYVASITTFWFVQQRHPQIATHYLRLAEQYKITH